MQEEMTRLRMAASGEDGMLITGEARRDAAWFLPPGYAARPEPGSTVLTADLGGGPLALGVPMAQADLLPGRSVSPPVLPCCGSVPMGGCISTAWRSPPPAPLRREGRVMDLMLRDGDLLPGADGQPLTVTGLAELRQRVMIRLCSRRSGFVPYPELGSELYRMNRADQERDRAAVEEALCPLTGVTVLSVEPAPGASGLEVRVELEADGVSETAGLLLTL